MHTFLLNNPVLLDKIPDVPYCLDLIGQQQAKEGLPDCFILQDHPVHVVQLRHYMRQDKFSLKVTERSESGLKHVFGASPVLVGVQVSKEHIGSPDGFQHMNGSGTVGSFSQAAAGPGTCIWHSGGDALVPGEWLEFVVELHVDATAKPGTIAVVSVVVEASNEPAGIFAPGEFRKAGTIKEKLNAFSETVKQKLSDSVETLKLKPKLLFWHGRRMFVLLLWTLLLLVVMVSSGDPDPLDIIWGEQRLTEYTALAQRKGCGQRHAWAASLSVGDRLEADVGDHADCFHVSLHARQGCGRRGGGSDGVDDGKHIHRQLGCRGQGPGVSRRQRLHGLGHYQSMDVI